MKNWERFKKEILEETKKGICIDCLLRKLRKGKCDGCEDCRNKSYNWLYEEAKIKLSQWEYDLIATNDMPHNRQFGSFNTYNHMKEKGYFKDVVDTSMSLEEILRNAEVEDNATIN